MTPVGARCPECAHVTRIPTLDVSPIFFARGMTAALIGGIVIGGFWALITNSVAFGGIFFELFLGLGIGWAISETVALSTNRKRGVALQIFAVLGVVLAFLIHQVLVNYSGIYAPDLVAAGVAAFFAGSRLHY